MRMNCRKTAVISNAKIEEGSEPLNVHQAFYDVTLDQVMAAQIFDEEDKKQERKDVAEMAVETPAPDDTDRGSPAN